MEHGAGIRGLRGVAPFVVVWLLWSAAACRRESPAPDMPVEPMRTPSRIRSTPIPAPAAVPGAADTGPVVTPTPHGTAAVAASHGTSADETAIAAMIEAWRGAWQAKALTDYLGHYAAEFEADGMDLAAWRAHKTRVFGRAGSIEVKVEGLRVQLEGDRGEARFRQHYTSGTHRDTGDKRLVLRRHEGHWLIVGEEFRAARR